MGNSYSQKTNDKSSFNLIHQNEFPEYCISPTAYVIPFDNIKILHSKAFRIAFDDFVDHIQLLREAIEFIDVIQDEDALEFYIDEYCQKITDEDFMSDYQQQRLPWPLLWIWHVHRLHHMAYYYDCTTQLPKKQLLDPKCIYVYSTPSASFQKKPFRPSIDLVSASIDQLPFLEQFRSHSLYSCDLETIQSLSFQNMVQNYMAFLKLVKDQQIVVPTFDISLIWHTHLRNPRHYRCMTTALCGSVLDHNESINEEDLYIAFENTRQLWRSTYDGESEQSLRAYRRETTHVNDFNLNPTWSIDITGSFERTICAGINTEECDKKIKKWSKN